MSALQHEGPAYTGAGYASQRGAFVDISPTRRRIRHEVYGDEYPEEVDPRSYLTWTELRRISRELGVGPGATLIDLGCGPGGPGLWVARETGAAVVGIDLEAVGVTHARERARSLGLAERARFEVADIVSTGLPDASLDAAMSVDVLWAVLDKLGALQEVARILKPGARFAFTSWDRDLSPPGYPPPLNDHRPLLEQAGFDVESYEIQPDAEAKRRVWYERVVAAESTLIEEVGEAGAERMLLEAKRTLGLTDGADYLAHSRRILVVARKRTVLAAC
jgi:ubiquinone/menaquinone biosynthesis C-methylase UbiE